MTTIRVLFLGSSLTYAKLWPGKLLTQIGALLPGVTFQNVNRGISGAAHDRIYRNRQHFVDTIDPSIVVYETPNDAHVAKQFTPVVAMAGTQDLIEALRTGLSYPTLPVAVLTGPDVREHMQVAAPVFTLQKLERFYDMQRRLVLDPSIPALRRGSVLLDAGPLFRVEPDAHIKPDGFHPYEEAYDTTVLPAMAATLAKYITENLGSIREPTTAPPPVAWPVSPAI